MMLEIVNPGYGFSGNAQYLGEKIVLPSCWKICGDFATPVSVERPVS